MKIYISGPIKGTTDYEARFQAAADSLKREGLIPIDPVKIVREHPDSCAWSDAECLAYEIGLLSECDAIWLMHGWKDSGGAIAEAAFASRVGIVLLDEDDPDADTEGGNV